MNKDKSISIVVITWNGFEFLQQTVKKLLELSYSNIEYIYVDNGPIDGSGKYLKGINDITLISNKENLGASVARNQGASVAKGEYILFLDDDMLIENKNFLQGLLSFYQDLDNPAFVMPLFLNSHNLEKRITRIYGAVYDIWGVKKRQPEISIDKVMKAPPPFRIAIAQTGAIFVKKEIWNDIGGFDESQKFNLDDDDISTRAYIYGYNNYLYNKEFIIHLGIPRRLDKDRYAWNDLTYLSGKAKSIVKNFSGVTISYMLFLAVGRMFAEAIYHSVQFKSIKILGANFNSFFIFLRDLPETLESRKVIQEKRRAKDSSILQFKTPKFR